VERCKGSVELFKTKGFMRVMNQQDWRFIVYMAAFWFLGNLTLKNCWSDSRSHQNYLESCSALAKILELDYIKNTLCYMLVKFQDQKLYGGGEIQEVVVVSWGWFRDRSSTFGGSLYVKWLYQHSSRGGSDISGSQRTKAQSCWIILSEWTPFHVAAWEPPATPYQLPPVTAS